MPPLSDSEIALYEELHAANVITQDEYRYRVSSRLDQRVEYLRQCEQIELNATRLHNHRQDLEHRIDTLVKLKVCDDDVATAIKAYWLSAPGLYSRPIGQLTKRDDADRESPEDSGVDTVEHLRNVLSELQSHLDHFPSPVRRQASASALASETESIMPPLSKRLQQFFGTLETESVLEASSEVNLSVIEESSADLDKQKSQRQQEQSISTADDVETITDDEATPKQPLRRYPVMLPPAGEESAAGSEANKATMENEQTIQEAFSKTCNKSPSCGVNISNKTPKPPNESIKRKDGNDDSAPNVVISDVRWVDDIPCISPQKKKQYERFSSELARRLDQLLPQVADSETTPSTIAPSGWENCAPNGTVSDVRWPNDITNPVSDDRIEKHMTKCSDAVESLLAENVHTESGVVQESPTKFPFTPKELIDGIVEEDVPEYERCIDGLIPDRPGLNVPESPNPLQSERTGLKDLNRPIDVPEVPNPLQGDRKFSFVNPGQRNRFFATMDGRVYRDLNPSPPKSSFGSAPKPQPTKSLVSTVFR